jgi:hypothetical protein
MSDASGGAAMSHEPLGLSIDGSETRRHALKYSHRIRTAIA